MVNISVSHGTAHGLKGTVNLPFSKSISNRLLILRELCGTFFTIGNLSDADDTLLLEKLLKEYKVQAVLNAENAGTVLRFMTAMLAVSKGTWLLTGSDRMLMRPLEPLVSALRTLNATIEYAGLNGYPPVSITGNKLTGGSITIDATTSSQFISALLLIASFLPEGLQLKLAGDPVSAPYIDMTVALLRKFNVAVERSRKMITVGNGWLAPESISVEPDWSAASYWYSAVALSKQGEVYMPALSLDSIQGDSILAEMFTHFGTETHATADGIVVRKIKPASGVFTFDFQNHPDLFPVAAVTCAALGVDAVLSGLKNLRLKESDRIRSVASGLQLCGAVTDITQDDEMIIRGGHKLNTENVVIDSCGDHRIAMAFAQLAWHSGEIIIGDMSVSSKSYPGFVRDMEMMGALIKNAKL